MILRLCTVLSFFSFLSSCSDFQKQPFSITDTFIPCGWMGCGAQNSTSILFEETSTESPHSGETCIKIVFSACDEKGTGIYWINNRGGGNCNWGDVSGEDFSTHNFTKLTFWAKGATGKEHIKFGIGGINKSNKLYHDSLDAFTFATLTKSWKKYEIDLRDKKLHSVIGGFYWYANKSENPAGGGFFLDDVQLE